MIITKTTDLDTIKLILHDEKLFNVTYGQNTSLADVKINPSFEYLIISEDEQTIGFFQIREFTKLVVECHINLKSAFWGAGKSTKALNAVFNWLRENTAYLKVFTDVPLICEQVIALMQKINANPCGIIRDGCIYNKKLTDLILYDFYLSDIRNG